MSNCSDREMLIKAVALAESWPPNPWAAGAEAYVTRLMELKQYLRQSESDAWYAAECERMKDRAPA